MPPILLTLFSKFVGGSLWILGRVDELRGHQVINVGGDDTESPHERISRLRVNGRILRSFMVNGWYILSQQDVVTLLRHEHLSCDLASNKFMNLIMRSYAGGLEVPFLDHPSMLQSDAPDHTRLRQLTARGFTLRFVQAMEPQVAQLVDDLLEETPHNGHFDVIETIAGPLPAIVIAQMLGVPPEERHLFEEWSARLIGITEILDPARVKSAIEADITMRGYLQELTDFKRENRGQDLISELIAVEEDGDRLTVDELYATCVLLLIAGHETTTRLIGSCLYLLLQHPEQLEAVRRDRSLLPNAIEESLRFEPPVMAVSRTIARSFQYKGHSFKKGQLLLLSIAGANRDLEYNIHPERFDIHRDKVNHVSFGYGIHLCLGMTLARLESKVALNKLLDKYSDIQLAERASTWENSPFFRGLEHLDISVN